jgi:hypothetical protein
MTEPDGAERRDVDESPFALPAIEGLPFKKGSEEDLAIRRVIEEGERERAKQAGRD